MAVSLALIVMAGLLGDVLFRRLKLPRVGERVKNRLEGTVWKVIEEREIWHNDTPPGSTAMPAITVRLWCPGENQMPGKGHKADHHRMKCAPKTYLPGRSKDYLPPYGS